MPTIAHTGSAVIIPFPVRLRSAGATFDKPLTTVDVKTRIYDAAFSSNWYHEAAVEDAGRNLDT